MVAVTPKELQTRVAQLLEQNEHREAAQLLSDAIAEQGESGMLWNDWAVAQCAAGRFDDAERAFRRALQVDPAYAPAIENLGTLLCSLGKKSEGLPFLLQAKESASGAQRENLEKLAAMCGGEAISKKMTASGDHA